jgi:hypothetical protein
MCARKEDSVEGKGEIWVMVGRPWRAIYRTQTSIYAEANQRIKSLGDVKSVYFNYNNGDSFGDYESEAVKLPIFVFTEEGWVLWPRDCPRYVELVSVIEGRPDEGISQHKKFCTKCQELTRLYWDFHKSEDGECQRLV